MKAQGDRRGSGANNGHSPWGPASQWVHKALDTQDMEAEVEVEGGEGDNSVGE